MHREPTEENRQEAFRYLHGADWPATLHDLRMAAARLSLVEGKARSIANGGSTSREDLSGPITASLPQAQAGARATGRTERRRRDDLAGAIDLKSRAAGEKDDE